MSRNKSTGSAHASSTSQAQSQSKPAPDSSSAPAGAARNADSSTVMFRDIAVRAYENFLQRGGEHGRDREDWIAAEGDLIAESRRS